MALDSICFLYMYAIFFLHVLLYIDDEKKAGLDARAVYGNRASVERIINNVGLMFIHRRYTY